MEPLKMPLSWFSVGYLLLGMGRLLLRVGCLPVETHLEKIKLNFHLQVAINWR